MNQKTLVAILRLLCQIGFVASNVMQMTSAKFYDPERADADDRP